MEKPPGHATGTGQMLTTISTLAAHVSRITAALAATSTVSGLWLWLITVRGITGAWFSSNSETVLLLLLLLAPAGMLWFFYASVRALLGLPQEVRRLAAEGRIRSGDLATAFRGAEVSQPRWQRAWRVFRSVLELRGLLFRSKGLLVAAGMAVRLRAFNPASLLLLLAALLATAAISLAAVGGTLLLLLGELAL